MSVDDYRAAVSTAAAAGSAAPRANESPQIEDAVEPPLHAAHCTGAAAGPGVVLELSADFERRS